MAWLDACKEWNGILPNCQWTFPLWGSSVGKFFVRSTTLPSSNCLGSSRRHQSESFAKIATACHLIGCMSHCIKHFKPRVRVSKSNMTEYEFKYSRYSPRYLNAMGIHWLLAELSKCVQFRTHTQTAGSRYYPCWTLALWCLGVS